MLIIVCFCLCRFLCDPWDEPLCLLLFGSEGGLVIQVWMTAMSMTKKYDSDHTDCGDATYSTCIVLIGALWFRTAGRKTSRPDLYIVLKMHFTSTATAYWSQVPFIAICCQVNDFSKPNLIKSSGHVHLHGIEYIWCHGRMSSKKDYQSGVEWRI